jgi:hypothetical protein
VTGARVAIAIALVAGCGAAAPPVPLTPDWPAKPQDFEEAKDGWTREGKFRRDYQEVFSVQATFKSPAWRAAWVAREARHRDLDAAGTTALVGEQQAAAAKAHEFELIVTTWDPKENDLHRGERASWQVAMIDDKGQSIAPLKIVRDNRPRHVLRADFPEVGDFAEAYVATFPTQPPVLGPDVKTLRLRFSSARGATEVRWEAP